MTRGSDGGGLTHYLAGPGTQNEHTEQQVVTSNLGLEQGAALTPELVRDLTGDLMRTSRAFPENRPSDGQGPIWHCSLSLPAGEHMDPARWVKLAERFMDRVGFPADARWFAVSHGLSTGGDEHVHIAANLVRENGEIVSLRTEGGAHPRQVTRDRAVVSAVVNGLEHEFGLTVLPSRECGTGVPGLSKGELARATASGVMPEREQLRIIVRRAAALSPDRESFITRLTADGVTGRFVRDGKGFAAAVHGSNAWYPGGALAADLTAVKLDEQWRHRKTVAPPASPAVAHRAAGMELRALTKTLESGALGAAELASAAHDVAGALSVAAGRRDSGRVTPDAARECGRMASRKGPVSRGHKGNLGTVVMAFQAMGSGDAVASALLLRQLMVTVSALRDAHNRVGSEPRRTAMTDVSETPARTSAAIRAEARSREVAARTRAAAPPRNWLGRVHDKLYSPDRQANLWSASDVARSRIVSELEKRPEFRPPLDAAVPARVAMVTDEQARRIGHLSKELGVEPNGRAVMHMTERDAQLTIGQMEFALGPDRMGPIEEAMRLHKEFEAAEVDLPQVLNPDGTQRPMTGAEQDRVAEVIRDTAPGLATDLDGEAFLDRLEYHADPELVQQINTEIEAGTAQNRLDAYPDRPAEPLGYRQGDVFTTKAGMVIPEGGVPEEHKHLYVEQGEPGAARSQHQGKVLDMSPDAKWRMDPISPRQEATLVGRGYSFEDLEGMPRGVASDHVMGQLGHEDAVKAHGTYPATNEYHGKGKAAGKAIAEEAAPKIVQKIVQVQAEAL